MNRLATLSLAALALGLWPAAASAQMQPTTMRTDAIWAPTTTETITLDGNLSEAGWAAAPTIDILYGTRSGDPGSGFKSEGGLQEPTDPVDATIRFLVSGGQLYMAAEVKDNSVGGSREFNRFDGFLMQFLNVDGTATGGIGLSEYIYSWWYPNQPDGQAIPDKPGFIGRYGNFDTPNMRDQALVDRWDAFTTVNGSANDDSGDPDVGYTVEMRFDLSELGYDLTQPSQLGWGIGVYDIDGFFPFSDATFSSKRAWWQNSFGNTLLSGEGRIFVDPAVTVGSALPAMPYDLVIAQRGQSDVPTIDGSLNEPVWSQIEGTEILLINGQNEEEGLAVRASYPGIGPLVSRQFVDDVDGDATNPPPTVVDPARATVKWFYQGTTLYVGVDVTDAAISSGDGETRWDGFRIGINDRTMLEPNDNYLLPRDLAVRLDASGGLVAERALAALLADNASAAAFAASVDGTINDPSDSDTGYQIEMAIDLTAIGYPADLGDRTIFIGASLSDYDMLDDPAASYGSRAWFFRERGGEVAAYGYLDPSNPVASEGVPQSTDAIALMSSMPNPFGTQTTLRYVLPEAGAATIAVLDLLGRQVATVEAGTQAAGSNAAELRVNLPSGVYLWRVSLDGVSGQLRSAAGQFTVIR